MTDLDIAVAAYPETHPDARSAALDIQHLKGKIDAGANHAMTQFFFEPDLYLRFRDACVRAGINAPVAPGLLTTIRLPQLLQFAARCGASVLQRLIERSAKWSEDAAAQQRISTSVVIDLVHRLHAEGVDHFHLYTLNRAAPTLILCEALGLEPHLAAETPS